MNAEPRARGSTSGLADVPPNQNDDGGAAASGTRSAARSSSTTSSAPVTRGVTTTPTDFAALGAAADSAPEERAGQSAKYAMYFRMLRVGVPVDAVRVKMAQKGGDVCAKVLDLGEDAPMSRVEQVELAAAAESARAATKLGLGSKRGEVLRWDAVDVADLGLTVWDGAAPSRVSVVTLSEELKAIERAFAKEPARATDESGPAVFTRAYSDLGVGAAPKHKSALGAPAADAKSVLDPKRVQGVSIALRKVRLAVGQLCDALQSLDESVLAPPVVEVLASSHLWPASDEETRALRKASASGQPMHAVDAAVWSVACAVPDAATRVSALVFRDEFERNLEENARLLSVVSRACGEVVVSERLRALLRVAVLVGNQVNGTDVKAVSLASLQKLSTTRAVEGKRATLLDYAVRYFARVAPTELDVDFELIALNAARKVELEQVVKFARDSRKSCDAVRRALPQLDGFCADAAARLGALEAEIEILREKVARALAYFGVDARTDSHVFFEDLSAFLQLYKRALDDYRDQLARQEKSEKAVAARSAKIAAHSVSADVPFSQTDAASWSGTHRTCQRALLPWQGRGCST